MTMRYPMCFQARLINKLLVFVGLLLITACSDNEPAATTSKVAAQDPRNISYTVAETNFTLLDGYAEQPTAPNSASSASLTVHQLPIYGDLGSGTERDAAVVLIYNSGGSGTFYYLAAALYSSQGYQSSNAILLGDRISLERLSIQNHTIKTEILQRASDEPMSATADNKQTLYAIINDNKLSFVPAENIYRGWVSLGHEVRSFNFCDKNIPHWLQGTPSTLSELKTTYQSHTQTMLTGRPLLMTLLGQPTPAPTDGFGADYPFGFVVEGVLDASLEGHCREALVTITTPLAGSVVTSPLTVSGRARGNWFFEGDFPITLEDMAGNVIGRSYVSADGDWMTKDFVAFKGTINFTAADNIDQGFLVFQKDNPSERPELDDATRIPILFNH